MSRIAENSKIFLENNNKINNISPIKSTDTFKKYQSAVMLTSMGGKERSVAFLNPKGKKLVLEMVNKIMK